MALLNQDEQQQQGLLTNMQAPNTYAQQPMESAQVQPGEVRDTTAQNFLGGDIQGYMSPYTQNVVDTTMSELQRQKDLVQQQNQDAMIKSGAFGGGRHGVVEAETNRGFLDVAGRTAAQLQDQSFRFGAEQMRADQDRALQASLANQSTDASVAQLNAQLRQQAASANFDAATLAQRDNNLANIQERLTTLQHTQGLEADRERAELTKQRDELLAGIQEQRDTLLAGFQQQRDTLLHEQGIERGSIEWDQRQAELGGQQAAGLMAQLIQSIGAINQADMKVADKKAQIEALTKTTSSTISGISEQFNQPGLIEWASRMIESIDAAAAKAAAEAAKKRAPITQSQWWQNLQQQNHQDNF
jgi:hypothetical protein